MRSRRLFLCILIFCLGRSITYSVLTLRKRRFWYLGIDDLENTGNKEEYYKKLIDSTIRIIKHNQGDGDEGIPCDDEDDHGEEDYLLWWWVFGFAFLHRDSAITKRAWMALAAPSVPS